MAGHPLSAVTPALSAGAARARSAQLSSRSVIGPVAAGQAFAPRSAGAASSSRLQTVRLRRGLRVGSCRPSPGVGDVDTLPVFLAVWLTPPAVSPPLHPRWP